VRNSARVVWGERRLYVVRESVMVGERGLRIEFAVAWGRGSM